MIHELGHVSALPGEQHLSGGMIHARDGPVQLVASAHRHPSAGVDLLARTKGGPERDRAKAENRDCVVNVRAHKSRTEVLALLCATRPRVPMPLCGTPVLDDPNVGGDNST